MLAMMDNPEELRKYLWMLNDDLTTVDTVLKTGNVMVDAILNSKLSLIKSKNIAVNAKATVPAELKISAAISSAVLPILKIALFIALPLAWEGQGVWLAIPVAESITLTISIVLLVLGYNHESLQKKKRIGKIV